MLIAKTLQRRKRPQTKSIVATSLAVGVVRQPRVGIGNLTDDLAAVFHAEEIGLVVEAVGAFVDLYTAVGRLLKQLPHVPTHSCQTG